MQRSSFVRRASLARIASASITAVALVSIGFAPAAIAYAAAPSIAYTSSTTTPYSQLTVSGSGFAPSEDVALSFGLSTSHSKADMNGSFTGATIAVPNVPTGLYYLIAVGQSSGLVAFTPVYVSAFFPTASPSGWYVSPGSTLTWSGSGFAPGEQITVADSHGTTIATFASDTSGMFSARGATTIPLTARNSTVSYTVQGYTSNAVIPVNITVSDLYPNVIPSLWYALPGTSLGVTGSGFGPGEGVSVYLGTSTAALAHASADTTGSFSVPSLALPYGSASAQFRFVGDTTGVTALAPITLAPYYPQVTPSAWYAAPGSTISLSGSGFAPSEPVVFTVGTGPSLTADADATGHVAATPVTLPATPNSNATIRAQGSLSGAMSTISVAIGQYYPDVVPSAWYTYPGNSLSFSGTGFAPHETIAMSGTMSGSAATDAFGSFSGLVSKIPASANGTAQLTFTGATSGASQLLGITLGVRSSAIWFDNYYGQGGTPLTVFGAGFGNGENVALSANGSVFSNATADATGALAAHTAMPFSPPGALTITASGTDTGASAQAALTVAPAYPGFELGSYAVAAGSALTLIGHGYLPGDPITITTDRTASTTVANFAADNAGNFSDTSFVLPASWMSGPLTVTAHSGHSYTDSSIILWVIGK